MTTYQRPTERRDTKRVAAVGGPRVPGTANRGQPPGVALSIAPSDMVRRARSVHDVFRAGSPPSVVGSWPIHRAQASSDTVNRGGNTSLIQRIIARNIDAAGVRTKVS